MSILGAYHSEVAIKVYGEEANMVAFKYAYDDARANLREVEREFVDRMMAADDKNGFSDGIFSFHAKHTQWRDWHCEVDFFIALLARIKGLKLNSEFVRMGGREDDIEVLYQGEHTRYMLSVVRTRMIDGI